MCQVIGFALAHWSVLGSARRKNYVWSEDATAGAGAREFERRALTFAPLPVPVIPKVLKPSLDIAAPPAIRFWRVLVAAL